MEEKFEALKLENQISFPLYACSKEVIRKYKPFLDGLDLTYTQYLAMLVLWEKKEISVKELGAQLFLDSGTLTPVLKTLEKKQFVSRQRSTEDERVLIVSLTKVGLELRERAADIPHKVSAEIPIGKAEVKRLHDLLNLLLERLDEE